MLSYFRNNDTLTEELLSTGKILVLPGPQNKFTELEMNSIRAFLNSGGHVLVMLGEGGEKKSNTNVNFLLEEFGIMVNNGIVKFLNQSKIKETLYISSHHTIFRQCYTHELQPNNASKGMLNFSRNVK